MDPTTPQPTTNDNTPGDLSSPGVKGDSIQEGTVVVVPDVIPDYSLACA